MRALATLLAATLWLADARAQDLAAELSCVPAEAVVGEPVDWVLEVRHASRYEVAPIDADPLQSLPEIDRLSWAVIGGPVTQTERAADGTSRTRFTWRVISLESGERALPELAVRAQDGTTATAAGAKLEIWTDLDQGEDAPRPIASFHDVEPDTALVGPFQVLVGLAVLAVALGLFWWRRARRRRPRARAAPPPGERLAALRGAVPSTPEGIRELAFELSHLARAAIEQRTGVGEARFAGLTDEEWLARARSSPGVPAQALDELAPLLTDLARIKFAGEEPTRFRVEELLGAVEALLARVDAAPPPAREVAA